MSRRAPAAGSLKEHPVRRPVSSAPTRRAPSGRKPRRSTAVWLSVGLAVTVLILATQWALHSSLLRVQHVTLVGELHESASQVLIATGLEQHPMMLSVSSGSLKSDLSVFPWVQSVRVIKHWPDSLTVSVTEVRPVAVAYDAQGHLRFVSARGRDLGPAPVSYTHLNFNGRLLLVVTTLLVVFGTIAVASASEGQAVANGGSSFSIILRDLVYLGFGLFALYVVARLRLSRIVRAAPLLILVGLAMLAAVKLVGVTSDGGKRWLNLHLILLQPSEMFKLFTVLFLAWLVQNHHEELSNWKSLLVRCV